MRPVPALVALVLVVGACGGTNDGSRDPAAATSRSSGATPASEGAPSSASSSTSVDSFPAGDEGFAPPVLLGEVADTMLGESSGLVASRRNPGLLWTHNDSGDEPRLYCLTGEAARCGTWAVTDAEAFDWEDMAAGPGPVAGRPYLYVGDIGDNRRTRPDVVVYRLAEPAAPAAGEEAGATAPAVGLRLRYEDGPHDAEALLVHPVTGDLYVITKDLQGAGVYKAARGSTVLVRVADFDLGLAELVTGADIAPDGRRVVVCTYRQGYELAVPAASSGFDDIWGQGPRPIDLGARTQGEAIAYRLDGEAVLTTSERSPFPLHEVVRR